MSNVYILEPPTTGKVLLVTSFGDIDIELWTKEAPLACRNFIQLCMEGYYDNTVFHRIVKGFIVQCGDPTGTGQGGESIYGGPFKDEFHQRLRFTRRGLVAMANAGPNDNQSQFFFTLDRLDDLNKKHTIFGKIGGDTIFNLLKIGEVPVVDNDRPEHPPKIIRAEILNNPFDDIEPRVTKKKAEAPQKNIRKGTKDLKLLSFGDDAEADASDEPATKPRMRSSHDVLKNDPRLRTTESVLEGDVPAGAKRPAEAEAEGGHAKVRKTTSSSALTDAKQGSTNDTEIRDGDSDVSDEESFDARMKTAILSRRDGNAKTSAASGAAADGSAPAPKTTKALPMTATDRKTAAIEASREESRKLQEEMRAAKEKARRGDVGVDAVPAATDAAIRAYEEERAKYVANKRPKSKESREEETKLKSTLGSGEGQSDAIFSDGGEGAQRESNEDSKGHEDDAAGSGWLSHRLEFAQVERAAYLREGEDEFDIHDPRNPLNKRRREQTKHSGGRDKDDRRDRRSRDK